MRELGVYDGISTKMRGSTINQLVEALELYKTQNDFYPDSLKTFKKSLPDNSHVWVYDPPYNNSESGPRYFYYKLVDDKHYYLLGVGPDNLPFTNDDIVPMEPLGMEGKTGLLNIKIAMQRDTKKDENDIRQSAHITDSLDRNTGLSSKKISKQPNDEKGEKDIYPNIHIPEFKGALDVKRIYDYSNRKEVLKYYIYLPYPPNDLISYYDNFFSKIGMKIYGNSVRQWRYIKNVPRIYESNWVDDNEYIKAHLGIKYEDLYGNNKYIGYVLKVSCHVKPFLSGNESVEFTKRIKDTDEGRKFLQFTVKYSNNGVFDSDKALEMNPDNELLKKFVVIRNNNRDEINQKYRAYIDQLKP